MLPVAACPSLQGEGTGSMLPLLTEWRKRSEVGEVKASSMLANDRRVLALLDEMKKAEKRMNDASLPQKEREQWKFALEILTKVYNANSVKH
jgi:hypothetical protein